MKPKTTECELCTRGVKHTHDKRCDYWRELEFHDADRKFDAGEFSGSRQKVPTSEACGDCPACRELHAQIAGYPKPPA